MIAEGIVTDVLIIIGLLTALSVFLTFYVYGEL